MRTAASRAELAAVHHDLHRATRLHGLAGVFLYQLSKTRRETS